MLSTIDSDKLYEEAVTHLKEDEMDDAFRKLTLLADQGHNNAIKKLNNLYYQRIEHKQNYSEVLEFYQKGAENSGAYSQNYLGYMYDVGLGVDNDYQKALELYKKAADQGNMNSLNNLGYMHDRGLGVEKDYQKAIELYLNAIDQGNVNAINNLQSVPIKETIKYFENRITKLKEELVRKDQEIDELKYLPGGPGYKEALEHYYSLMNQVDQNLNK